MSIQVYSMRCSRFTQCASYFLTIHFAFAFHFHYFNSKISVEAQRKHVIVYPFILPICFIINFNHCAFPQHFRCKLFIYFCIFFSFVHFCLLSLFTFSTDEYMNKCFKCRPERITPTILIKTHDFLFI